MSLQYDATQVLGELFITGFSGLELSQTTQQFFKRAKIGGVLLFRQNYDNPTQVTQLIDQIQNQRTELPLWISVDHEGGRVQRFQTGFTKIPTAAAIAAQGSPKLAFEIAQMMAHELRSVGINLNFCPIADISTNPKNPVIGDRAFGTTADEVSKFSSAMVRGHLIAGVQPCVKHFPGHGDTSTDSHFALPSVSTSEEVLKKREFIPFLKGFKSGCHFVMTAHVIIQSIEPKLPATLSSKILKDILREQLGYQGIIISDDLEMQAITDHYGAKEAPRLALEAGCDLLIYRTEEAAVLAFESLTHDLENGNLDPEIVIRAAQRSTDLKQKVLMPYVSMQPQDREQLLGTEDNLQLVQQVN